MAFREYRGPLVRCRFVDPYDPLYIEYHDKEWAKPTFDDAYLWEMLLLEMMQAGLSWKTVLHKREAMRQAFDDFDVLKISRYDEAKIDELLETPDIIHNRRKIKAMIANAKIFIEIVSEYGSFYAYLKTFTKGHIIYETGRVNSSLSDMISKDLYAKGMRFVGSIIIYSYLQAIGVIDSHEKDCDLYVDIELVDPKDDLDYEAKLLSDPQTMSYNAGYDVGGRYDYESGCIYLEKKDHHKRYQKRLAKGSYFAYIRDRKLDDYVGTVGFHYDDESGVYMCDIIIEARYRKRHYFKKAMYLLFIKASDRGIKELYDIFDKDRGVLDMFMMIGFDVVKEVQIERFGKFCAGYLVRCEV